MKGERELEENRAELACFVKNVEARTDVALVFDSGRGFVGEALPEFRGKEEGRVGGNTFEPRGGVVWANGLIEGSIDFDSVEKLGEESGFVKIFRVAGRIDVAGPVGVGPACWTDAQAALGWRLIRGFFFRAH